MRLHIATHAFSLALLGVAGTCPETQDRRVARGNWGGDHIAMTVTDSGATVEYDCARGSIDEPLRTDASSRFSALGVHIKQHGGPVTVGELPDRQPARYTGASDGTSMTLHVLLTNTGELLGPFTLRRGATPRVYRCL